MAGLHNLEKKLEEIPGLNALFLRAGYFMENLLPQAGVIKSMGIMAGPVREDLPLPMIATRDIGAYAAEALLKLDFVRKSAHELQGPRDVTYIETAKIVGAAIGKEDLAYKLAPAAQLKPVLMQMGMSSNMADLLLEMADALNSGHMKMLETRSPANTTPTTLETFVAEAFLPRRHKVGGAEGPRARAENVAGFRDGISLRLRVQAQPCDDGRLVSILGLTFETLRASISGLAGPRI